MQAQITVQWLLARGYTLAGAARCLGRSRQHVTEVVAGKRQSPTLIAKLRKLPKRQLRLREPRKEMAV